MRTALLCLLTACAHPSPARPAAASAVSASAAGESTVRFGPPASGGPADTGVLLRLGAPAVDAANAGADRLPPPGRRINLEVEDADLHGVLRLFADASGLDFVIDEGVDRRITAELRDVPWNHALLAILDAHGLAAAPLPGGRGVEVVAVR